VAVAMIISCAHNAARVAMNQAVEFVLIAMFGASVLNRLNGTGKFLVIFHGNYNVLFGC
jgi:hypothetical protein